MVQMKVSEQIPVNSYIANFISHMVQIKVLHHILLPIQKFLYIPHGSDESVFLKKTMFVSCSLYPTWFR